MTTIDFDFAAHAAGFDAHISSSVPGYERLRWWCTKLSRRFIQDKTRVLDVGCSTGSLLRSIRKINQHSRPGVEYVGIDVSKSFDRHWQRPKLKNLQFEVRDALDFNGYENASLVTATFTLQFIAERKKFDLLKRISNGLVEGGALFIAEKALATNSMLQEAIASTYYDHKSAAFSAEEILEKERQLRGVMTPWTKLQLVQALCRVGFQSENIETFWQDGPFLALVAIKRSRAPE